MRFIDALKKVSLGVGILAISSAAASAQSLSGVTAQLVTPLSSQTAKVGAAVTAKLDGSVKIADGETLVRGTELEGTVSAVQTAEGRGAASVSVVFTTAKLKDGKEIPIKATLLGAYASGGDFDFEDRDDLAASTPAHVSNQYSIDQEPGALNNVSLRAAVADPTSGTFSQKKGNFKIAAGSYLEIGVAPAGTGSSTTSAAE